MTMEFQHAPFVINENDESAALPAGKPPYDDNFHAQRRLNLGYVTFNRQ
jgi:hypothetical protein